MDKLRRKSRLRASIQMELIRLFVAGVPARTAAELTGVNRNTAILYYHKLREIITRKLAEQSLANSLLQYVDISQCLRLVWLRTK